ncbi:MAG: glucosaminidase domain-containing protein [Tannerella sp.]|jgi:flagellum-specific peptidoglycan hydrolase FlgJ|nr:glucosaminidase domain-containing protein [Tannerella sp.]
MYILLACSAQGKSPETKTSKAPPATSATMNPAFVNYINDYRKLAIRQQKKYKIPASITLAQALLESNGGQSYLALAGNNHFGLKSTDWQGLSICKYDAGVYACFRKYLYVYSSFEDHSRFIAERSFYRSLFKLSLTDYKGWATGLNRCGYAKDPQYGAKLIQLIEQYHLYYYDTAGENDPPYLPNATAAPVAKNKAAAPVQTPSKPATAKPAPAKKAGAQPAKQVRTPAAKTSSTAKK